MDDVERRAEFVHGFVRAVQTVQGTAHDAGADGRGHGDVHGIRALEQAGQGFAVDVLHDQEELFAFLEQDHIQRRRDVGVLDARHQPGLVEKHGNELGVAREVGMEGLDRDCAREPDVAAQAAEMHARHATRGDLVVDNVAPNHPRWLVFRGQGGRRCREHLASISIGAHARKLSEDRRSVTRRVCSVRSASCQSHRAGGQVGGLGLPRGGAQRARRTGSG